VCTSTKADFVTLKGLKKVAGGAARPDLLAGPAALCSDERCGCDTLLLCVFTKYTTPPSKGARHISLVDTAVLLLHQSCVVGDIHPGDACGRVRIASCWPGPTFNIQTTWTLPKSAAGSDSDIRWMAAEQVEKFVFI
jgi:hypothetical protein